MNLEVHSELCDLRRKERGVVFRIPVRASACFLQLGGALQNRGCQWRPRLATGRQTPSESWQRKSWRGSKTSRSKSGRAQGVDHGPVAIEQARAQINGTPRRGAPDRGADFGSEGISNAERDRQQGGRHVTKPKTAQGPEDDEGQDTDIHPGDDQNMVGAGALKIGARVAVDEGLIANDHRINQRGFARRPEFMDLGDDCAVQPAAPKCDVAARKAREPFDVFCFRGAQGGDMFQSAR